MTCIVGLGSVVPTDELLVKYNFESVDELEYEFEEVGFSIIIVDGLSFVAIEESLRILQEKEYIHLNTFDDPTKEEKQIMEEYTGNPPELIVFALETGVSAVEEALDEVTKSITQNDN